MEFKNENGLIQNVKEKTLDSIAEQIGELVAALIKEEGVHREMEFSVKYDNEKLNIDMKY